MAGIGVLGPGGVGGLLAARLGAAGHDVTLVATERTAAHITLDGLRFRGPGGEAVHTRPLARPYLTGRPDVLFVAVKATDLLDALARVPAPVLGTAAVVPLLNGVDHLDLLRAAYPDAAVVAASISVEATRHGPGDVEQVTTMADVVVADATLAGAAVAGMLRDAGMDVATHQDERAVLWRKLAFLAPFALLTTATDSPIGQARTLRDEWLDPLVDEAATAAARHGVDIDRAAIQARLRRLPDAMTSSMLKDQRAGRTLELDAIAGPILRTSGVDSAVTTAEAARTILARGTTA